MIKGVKWRIRREQEKEKKFSCVRMIILTILP